jgi:hypothetical protein
MIRIDLIALIVTVQWHDAGGKHNQEDNVTHALVVVDPPQAAETQTKDTI